jgi:hypothetical protein
MPFSLLFNHFQAALLKICIFKFYNTILLHGNNGGGLELSFSLSFSSICSSNLCFQNLANVVTKKTKSSQNSLTTRFVKKGEVFIFIKHCIL